LHQTTAATPISGGGCFLMCFSNQHNIQRFIVKLIPILKNKLFSNSSK
jgi:hypothetical protein